ncbi:MAG TPA: ATP-dependent Clp protease proteolytic subunit, partial [Flavobacteriales bacterium]|nr:ATP-dependent Clp protease proteolytic subunit [Flavobacteriales bacterium]
DFVAEDLMRQINDAGKDEIVLRVNSGGGQVFANYGICAKMAEHGNVMCKVDGIAMSSAANLLFYASKVECLDTSVFLFHRADMFCENDQDKEFLAKVNLDLKKKMLMKVNADLFKECCGVTIDEMFSAESRIDVILNAKQAKQIGLVNKIVKLTPSENERIEAYNRRYNIAANSNDNPNKNSNTMTIEKLKAEHPAVYQQIFEQGVTAGVSKERDRVGAFMAFVELDPKAVKEGIVKGENMSETQRSEFAIKVMSKVQLEKTETDGGKKAVTTGGSDAEVAAKTEKEKELAAYSESLDKRLGLKK